jgi:hypothetical protein
MGVGLTHPDIGQEKTFRCRTYPPDAMLPQAPGRGLVRRDEDVRLVVDQKLNQLIWSDAFPEASHRSL